MSHEPDFLPLFPRRPTGLIDRRLHAIDIALRAARATQRKLAEAVALKLAGKVAAARAAVRMAAPDLATLYDLLREERDAIDRLLRALWPEVELWDRRRRRRRRGR